MTIVLARVQHFLPQIEQANQELQRRDPRNIDIEHIEETDERVIQMASKNNTSTTVYAEIIDFPYRTSV